MSKLIKTTMAAVISSGLIMGSMAVPTAASARTTYQCEVTKSNSAKTGMILGAIAGGLLGSQVSKNEKGLGAVGGAVIGGVLGNKIGKDQGKDTCINAQQAVERQRAEDRYYSKHYNAKPYYSNSGRNDGRYASRY